MINKGFLTSATQEIDGAKSPFETYSFFESEASNFIDIDKLVSEFTLLLKKSTTDAIDTLTELCYSDDYGRGLAVSAELLVQIDDEEFSLEDPRALQILRWEMPDLDLESIMNSDEEDENSEDTEVFEQVALKPVVDAVLDVQTVAQATSDIQPDPYSFRNDAVKAPSEQTSSQIDFIQDEPAAAEQLEDRQHAEDVRKVDALLDSEAKRKMAIFAQEALMAKEEDDVLPEEKVSSNSDDAMARVDEEPNTDFVNDAELAHESEATLEYEAEPDLDAERTAESEHEPEAVHEVEVDHVAVVEHEPEAVHTVEFDHIAVAEHEPEAVHVVEVDHVAVVEHEPEIETAYDVEPQPILGVSYELSPTPKAEFDTYLNAEAGQEAEAEAERIAQAELDAQSAHNAEETRIAEEEYLAHEALLAQEAKLAEEALLAQEEPDGNKHVPEDAHEDTDGNVDQAGPNAFSAYDLSNESESDEDNVRT
jgi:hypothetical protein